MRLAAAAGLAAERTWHLAQSPDATERACDVRIAGRPAHVKRLRNGFSALYDGLEGVEILFTRRDGSEWLATVRAESLLDLLKSQPPPIYGAKRRSRKHVENVADGRENEISSRKFDGATRPDSATPPLSQCGAKIGH